MSKSVPLSEKALKRIPRYLSYLKALQDEQCEYVTAPAVAKHLMEIMEERRLIRNDGFSVELNSSGNEGNLTRLYESLV